MYETHEAHEAYEAYEVHIAMSGIITSATLGKPMKIVAAALVMGEKIKKKELELELEPRSKKNKKLEKMKK